MDELLEFVEWSRERVGPDGLVLLHTTMAPMFATENFANDVCCMEFGYGQVSTSMPKPGELPLEWNFAGARSRAVIEYGTVARNAAPDVHQLFYLTALVTGVATWPASDAALKLFEMLKPLGDLNLYQFQDWRNRAVRLDNNHCLSAVYSRPGQAYLVLVNLSSEQQATQCKIESRALANPIAALASAEIATDHGAEELNVDSLAQGKKVVLPAEGAVLLRAR